MVKRYIIYENLQTLIIENNADSKLPEVGTAAVEIV